MCSTLGFPYLDSVFNETDRGGPLLPAGDDLWYHPNFSRSETPHKIMPHSCTAARQDPSSGIIPICSGRGGQHITSSKPLKMQGNRYIQHTGEHKAEVVNYTKPWFKWSICCLWPEMCRDIFIHLIRLGPVSAAGHCGTGGLVLTTYRNVVMDFGHFGDLWR